MISRGHERPIYTAADRRRIALVGLGSLAVLIGMTLSDHDDRSQNQKNVPTHHARSGVIVHLPETK